MIKILKKIWPLFLLVLVSMLLLPTVLPEKSYASNVNNDYIKYTIKTDEEGKITQSLIFSINLPSGINVLKKEAFETELLAKLNTELNQQKQLINNKFATESLEQYSPEKIIFGNKGFAVKGDGYAGFAIQYPSFEVFKYYNDIETSLEKGFFMDKSVVRLNNPFNDAYQYGQTIITVAEKYRNLYITAGEEIDLDGYLASNYFPYYDVDYVTLSHRAKSNSSQRVQENQFYHHFWQMEDMQLLEDYEMFVSLNIIHTYWWYLLGTAVPLFAMGVSILVVAIKNKSKKKKTTANTNGEN